MDKNETIRVLCALVSEMTILRNLIDEFGKLEAELPWGVYEKHQLDRIYAAAAANIWV